MAGISLYDTGLAVTPHDSNDNIYRGLYIGTAGTLKVTTRGGQELSFGAVTAGTHLPLAVVKVWSTGTSASNIVGLR